MTNNYSTNKAEALKPTYTTPCVIKMNNLIQGFGNCIDGSGPSSRSDCSAGVGTVLCNIGNDAVTCANGNSA